MPLQKKDLYSLFLFIIFDPYWVEFFIKVNIVNVLYSN
jgi:hypothetical protein